MPPLSLLLSINTSARPASRVSRVFMYVSAAFGTPEAFSGGGGVLPELPPVSARCATPRLGA
ncbi:MAG: hypothetical protein IJ985_01135, partial [Akkermansia sp.]|nr:hypothetical protein [Akkermansia sp.]